MNQYKNLIFSICLKMTGDYFAAEDITQDTFIKAYKKYATFDGKNEKAWICRIATNSCIDYMKATERKNIQTDDEGFLDRSSNADNPLGYFESKSVVEYVKEKCMELSEPYSDIAVKYFVEGVSAKEIAQIKDINIKTIQTQIYRAREMLKKKVRREELLS